MNVLEIVAVAALPVILIFAVPKEILAAVKLVKLAPEIAGIDARVVVFPTEVTFPVRFALVVTVEAFPLREAVNIPALKLPLGSLFSRGSSYTSSCVS